MNQDEITTRGEDDLDTVFNDSTVTTEELNDTEEVSDVELKRRGLQSELDKTKAEKAKLAQEVEIIKAQQTQLIELIKSGGKTIQTTKELPNIQSPVQLMPDGSEYDPYEAEKPGTPSFKAKVTFDEIKEERLIKRLTEESRKVLEEGNRQQQATAIKNSLVENFNATEEELADFVNFTNNPNALSVEEMFKVFRAKKAVGKSKINDGGKKLNYADVVTTGVHAPVINRNEIDKSIKKHFPDDPY